MPKGLPTSIHKSTKQDYYDHVATIPLVDISAALEGEALIDNREQYYIQEGVTTFTVTIAGVTGIDAAQINGARTGTRVDDTSFRINVDTSGLTYDATSATATVQEVAGGAGVPLDRGNKKDISYDFDE